MLPFQYIYMENRTNGKRQLSFVCGKWKIETTLKQLPFVSANGKRKTVVCFYWAANDKRYQRLLCQQTCPSMRAYTYIYLHTYV